MLVIAGPGLFAGDETASVPTTSTAPPTTAPPGTTTTTEANLVEAPDVVGLTVADARNQLTAAGFAVDAAGDPHDLALVVSQDPAPGAAVAPGTTIRLESAPYTPACREGWSPSLPPPGPGEREITVLFRCAADTDPAGTPTAVVRRVPDDADPIRATLEALLGGPTGEERAAGLQSFFSEETAGALESIVVEDGLAVVDFTDAILVTNASTSTGSEFFLAELNANLVQFAEIERIEYRVNGRCEAFWGWLQRECRVATREGLVDELPFGSCSAASSSTAPEDHAVELPEAVADTRALLLSLAVRCDLQELDRLAAADAASIVLSHLDLGGTPFASLEENRQGAPAVTLVETLAFPYAVHEVDGTDVFFWPDVAVPGFAWAALDESEIAELSLRYGEAAVRVSIDGGTWAGFSVEIDDAGRWRSFGQPLS